MPALQMAAAIGRAFASASTAGWARTPQRTSGGEGVAEEGTKGANCKGWGCPGASCREGLGDPEGGKIGRGRAAAGNPIPKSQGKTPRARGAVQVLLEAWTRSGTVGVDGYVFLDTTASAHVHVHAARGIAQAGPGNLIGPGSGPPGPGIKIALGRLGPVA